MNKDINGYILQSSKHGYCYGRTLKEIYDILKVFKIIYQDFKIERNDK